MSGEERVRKGVFVGAIEAGFVRQPRQTAERREHLLRRAFEEAPATHREQGVAHECHCVLAEDKRDMAERVAGNGNHPSDVLSKADGSSFSQSNVPPGNILARGT